MSYTFPYKNIIRKDATNADMESSDLPAVLTKAMSHPVPIECYTDYRVEKDGVVVSPIIGCFLFEHTIYYYTQFVTEYESKFVIEHGFIFIYIETIAGDITHHLLLSDQSAGTITHNTLLSEEHSIALTLNNETCGPALQVELKDGSKRWLFPHPDGQRAAWEHLQNTTDEDDALRILEIGQNILENHKSL